MVRSPLRQYLQRQNHAVVAALNDPALFPVAASSPEVSVRLSETGNRFEWDRTRRIPNAFIRYSGLLDFPEYWVHVDYQNYRKAFIQFLALHFNINQSSIGRSYHVDHMLHKAYAKSNGAKYVRLSLIPAGQNMQYGSSLEKQILSLRKQEPRDYFCPDYIICLKLLGIQRPKSEKHYLHTKSAVARKLIRMGLWPNDHQFQVEMLDNYFSIWPIIPK